MFILHLTFTDNLIYCFTLWFRQLTKFISFSFFNDTPIPYLCTITKSLLSVSWEQRFNVFFFIDKNLPSDWTNRFYQSTFGIARHYLALTNFHMSYVSQSNTFITMTIYIKKCRPIVIWYVHSFIFSITWVLVYEPTFVSVMHAFVIEYNVEIKSILLYDMRISAGLKILFNIWLGAVNIHIHIVLHNAV